MSRARATSPVEAFRLMLTGQSLIERPLHHSVTEPMRQVRELLGIADLALTNLEVAIETDAGWPTRETTLHVAPEAVLDSIGWFGFRGLALASNHAFDLGPPGITAALEATNRRGLLTAGTGVDATSAAAPAYGSFNGIRVALIGAVSAENPPQSHALDARGQSPARPGVNRIRVADCLHVESAEREVLRVPDEADMASLLKAVETASERADIVVVYLHNHYWADPQEITPQWTRALAHRCIDAGASVFFGHGTPVLQGVEIYRSRLIAYGLGSFVFHTRKPTAYGSAAWESIVVDASLATDGALLGARLHALVHGDHPSLRWQDNGDGGPSIADRATAEGIFARMARLSEGFGTRLNIEPGGAAVVHIGH